MTIKLQFILNSLKSVKEKNDDELETFSIDILCRDN